jgi:Predicted membrane protein (DUF2254)
VTDIEDVVAPQPARAGKDRRQLPSWRWEELRTTLWVVPSILVVVSVLLFIATFEIDIAAFHGHLALPVWIRTGNAASERQVLIAIAAAVITVIGVVFSITILALTLASQQFGPRMMRNFVRDIGNQVTLGIFVGTFVYSVLALGSIDSLSPAFVPHLSTSVAEALLLLDLGVLIYFIHHIAKSIQLPEVIAGIARDLISSIDAEFPDAVGAVDETTVRRHAGKSVPELLKLIEEHGAAVPSQVSGYIQYVGYSQLVGIATRTDSVIRLEHRPGHYLATGRSLAMVWPRGAAPEVALALSKAHVTGPHRTLVQDPVFAIDQLVDRHQSPLVRGERHLHGPDLHRLALGGPGSRLRPGPRRGRLPGRDGQRASDRVRSVVRPHGEPCLRQDPPSGRRHAGGPDPAHRLRWLDHARHDVSRAARRSPAPGRHGPALVRGDGHRAERPGRDPVPLSASAR